MAQTSAELRSSLTLPDNSGGGIYSYSGLLASIFVAVSSIYYLIARREPVLLIILPISLLVAFLLFRSIFTSAPETISIDGNSVVLTNVPSWFIWLDKAIVPLVISKRVAINKADFQLEWIGQSLTWNDLQNGKSVHLAHSSEAQTLLGWFNVHGIPVPSKPL